MSRIYIDNPIENGFTRVPNTLWTREMSLKAKGLFAFLLSFHHGSAPTVAEIEAALGIGKDARQSAFRELVEQGLAGWRIVRNGAGRVVAKEMWISSRPLLLDLVQAGLDQEPENPADGSSVVHEPGFPAAGLSGSKSLKTRQQEPENPAILTKTKNKKRAGYAPSASQGIRPLSISDLSPFQRSRLLSGKSCLVSGQTVAAGSLAMETLRSLLRGNGLENEGAV